MSISEYKNKKTSKSKNDKVMPALIDDGNSFNDILKQLDESELKITVQLHVIKKGKRITNITGFIDKEKIDSITHELKKTIGTGGTSKNGIITLQGDQRTKVTEYLLEQGITSDSIEVI